MTSTLLISILKFLLLIGLWNYLEVYGLRRFPSHLKTTNVKRWDGSEALKLTRRSSFKLSASSVTEEKETKHVVVVGAGWAGFGAAKALCEGGCKVTMIDVIPDPTGTAEMMSATGKPIEPGQKGFWYDYPNIAELLKEIELPESEVFTPFLNSSFYSPAGLEATAPIFSSSSLPQLPSPIGQVFASFSHFKRLPLHDRASIVGLLYAMLDMYRDEDTFKAYDRMSAYDLFASLGVSKRLIDDFLRPTLLVGLFKPPEELSAAVTMELLYYYALAHQTSFDVRWLKRGTISGVFFKGLYNKLQQTYGDRLTVLGGNRVTSLHLNAENNRVAGVVYTSAKRWDSEEGVKVIDDADAVVMAVGVKGLRTILAGSPELSYKSSQLSLASSLKAIDCISIRIWLDRTVKTLSPANVLAQFPQLRGAGGTFFMLDEFHSDHLDELWGGAPVQGSVVGVDFYNAGALLTLPDEAIMMTIMNELLPAVELNFKGVGVVDYHLQRYPEAVSWFSPGSYNCRPRTKVEGVDNLYCAGDWVVIQDPVTELNGGGSNDNNFNVGEHGAKGLCQERAYVSGLAAANRILLFLPNGSKTRGPKLAKILSIRVDEPQVLLGRKVNRKIAGGLKKIIGLDAPWIR